MYCLQWWSDCRPLIWSYDFEAKRIKDIFLWTIVNFLPFSYFLWWPKTFFFFLSFFYSHVTSCVIGTRKAWLLLRVGNFKPSGIDLCDSITWCIWLCVSLQNVTCGKIVFFPPLPFSFLLQPKMWRLNTKSRFSKIKPILGSIILSAAHVDFEGLRGRGVWGGWGGWLQKKARGSAYSMRFKQMLSEMMICFSLRMVYWMHSAETLTGENEPANTAKGVRRNDEEKWRDLQDFIDELLHFMQMKKKSFSTERSNYLEFNLLALHMHHNHKWIGVLWWDNSFFFLDQFK